MGALIWLLIGICGVTQREKNEKVNIRDLLEAGAHFGHGQCWNPRCRTSSMAIETDSYNQSRKNYPQTFASFVKNLEEQQSGTILL